MDNQKFIQKSSPESEDILTFTDEELIEIYNSLGFTTTVLAISENVFQDSRVAALVEGQSNLSSSIRFKIELELMKRNNA